MESSLPSVAGARGLWDQSSKNESEIHTRADPQSSREVKEDEIIHLGITLVSLEFIPGHLKGTEGPRAAGIRAVQ